MADYDIDEIDSAFVDFRAAVLPEVRPAGFDRARATARRRRAVRGVVLAGAVVVAVASPVAAGAVVVGRPHHAVTDVPSATPSGRPVPTDDGPATPAAALVCPSPAAHAGSANGSQGLAVTDLCDASLDVPGWPTPTSPSPGIAAGPNDCQGGPATFAGGHSQRDHGMMLDLGTGIAAAPTGAAAGDVNGDGRDDVVAILSCGSNSVRWISEVVAFGRGADGSIQTLGAVVPAGAVRQVMAIAINPDGIVRVEVGDTPKGAHGVPQPQWRSFAWKGTRFTQVGGPTSFPVNPSVIDFAVTAADLSFGPAEGGQRSGTLALTVRNLGQSSVPFRLTFAELPSAATLVPQQDCQPSPTYFAVCSYPGLEPGGIMTVTLVLQAPAGANLGGQSPGSRADAYVVTDQQYYETNPWNNVATFRVGVG